MSALSSVSNSSTANYAVQLAQTSAIERTLYNLGSAVQNGNLTAAGSILTAFIQANPQYATSSSSGSTPSQEPINQDFQNLASAISSNQTDAARSAWAQLKTDMAQAGVTNISSPADIAAQAVAQSKASMQQALLSTLFTPSSDSSLSLLGLNGSSSGPSAADPLSSVLSNWMTYQADGNASSQLSPGSTGLSLNTSA
jgi:hypothetical protein